MHTRLLRYGALALGAALGAALPHTRQEDEAVGEIADKVKGKAASLASDVYEDGKTRAADLYAKGKEGVAEVYDELTSGNGAGEAAPKANGLH